MRQMLNLCGYKGQFPVLERLCKDRNKIREEIMESSGLSKDQVKQCFLAAMFGGAQWEDDIGKDVDTALIKEFRDEMDKIGGIIRAANNQDLAKAIAERKGVKVSKLKNSQFSSYFCQELERIAIEAALSAVAKAGNFDATACVYQYDGFFIPKEYWREEYITLAEKAVKNATGLTLNFEMKKMEESIDLSTVKAVPYTVDVLSPETLDEIGAKPEIQSSRYLEINTAEIEHDRTIVIQAQPGVGKTTAVARYVAELREKSDDEVYVLLISNLRSLGRQMMQTFAAHDIEVTSHLEVSGRLSLPSYDAVSVCVNSLHRVGDEELSKTVVVIDEISSLAETICTAQTIERSQIAVVKALRMIMKNAKQIICMDATVSDAAMGLLHPRSRSGLRFIQSTTQSFKDVPAVKHTDEDRFLQRIERAIEEECYFLAAFDSATTATKYFCDMRKKYSDKSYLMTLVTRESPVPDDVVDTGEYLRNRFVFYSPSITTGVDISSKTATLQFVHITGNSISPLGCFQQACRTRNISELHYFADIKRTHSMPLTIQQAEKTLTDLWMTGDSTFFHFRNMVDHYCKVENEHGEDILMKNSIFKTTTAVLSIESRLRARFVDSFEHFLRSAGFEVKNEKPCTAVKLSKERDVAQRQLRHDYREDVVLQMLNLECGTGMTTITDNAAILDTLHHFVPSFKLLGFEDGINDLSDPRHKDAIRLVVDMCTNRGAQAVARIAEVYFDRRDVVLMGVHINQARDDAFVYLADKSTVVKAATLRLAFHQLCGIEADPLDISPEHFNAGGLKDETFQMLTNAFGDTGKRRPKKPSTQQEAHEFFSRLLRRILGGTDYPCVVAEKTRAPPSAGRKITTSYKIDADALCRVIMPRMFETRCAICYDDSLRAVLVRAIERRESERETPKAEFAFRV